MDEVQTVQEPLEHILERIDAIIQELQDLRRSVLTQARPPDENLTAQLYEALGKGSRDEYNSQSDWQRFEP
jgi:hypothetical protein